MDTRKKVFFCNIAIMVLCVVSILSYFLMPFWKVKVQYTLSADAVEELMPESFSNNDEENKLYSNIDFEEIVGEDGIHLELAISLKTADILKSISADPDDLVEDILEDNVKNLLDQLDETIDLVIRNTVTTVVKTSFAESIKEEIKDRYNYGDSEATEKLKKAGLTDSYLEKQTEELVDIIYKKGTTSATAADATLEKIDNAIEMMRQKNPADFYDLELSPSARADLREELIERFETLEKSDGTLDPDAFTTDLLLDLLEDKDSDTSAALATPLASKGSSKTSSDRELRKALTEKLLDLLGGAEDAIASVIKGLSILILFTFVVWLIPIAKIGMRWKKENNAVKLGLPIWFGSYPFIFLSLLPTLALSILKNSISLSGALGEIDLFKHLTVRFSSCAIVSFIIAIALAVFTIVYYGKLRKLLKSGNYVKAAPKAKASANNEINFNDMPVPHEATSAKPLTDDDSNFDNPVDFDFDPVEIDE